MCRDFGFPTKSRNGWLTCSQTRQLANLQVGDEGDANFVASTVPEIEALIPLLKAIQQAGRRINILYGIPLVPSQIPRLADLARKLGKDSISVMIDHPDQVEHLKQFAPIASYPACVFVKVDAGYHRAGLPPTALNKDGMLEKLAEAEKLGHAKFLGVYSHNSLSYGGASPAEAMTYLTSEIASCRKALEHNSSLLPQDRKLVISVGATPQVVSSQNLLYESQGCPEAETLKALLRDLHESTKVELHAGVYPVLDMQQLSTNAVFQRGKAEEEIAISVVAEVCSLYNDGERSKPEVLVAAGTLALGREPCPSYRGWGVVSPWRRDGSSGRLIVERISQEHGIVSWEMGKAQNTTIPLQVGQPVRIYPNHACITGALYGWYLIVDSSQDPDSARIVDVWVRTAGW